METAARGEIENTGTWVITAPVGTDLSNVVLEAPLVDGINVASLDVVEAALGRTYSNLTFVPTVSVSGALVPLGTPVLSIAGKASNLSDLQCLSISRAVLFAVLSLKIRQ
ncbi:MAG: hypothetical protein LBR38_02620 [Synergistaceae bacterium]|nr:hypothetical protein [Synergistaceae bacterium]